MSTEAETLRRLLETVADPNSAFMMDEHTWRLAQMVHLEEGELEKIDRKHLAMYLAEMTRSEQRALESHMVRLLQHLLKIKFQPEKRTPSWNKTVLAQQRAIRSLFRGSPGLRQYVPEFWREAYPDAVREAAAETTLPLTAFPPENPWTLDAALAFDPLAE